MSSAIDTVRRLVALAVDPGATEGESRNAAVAACRLIAKQGLFAELAPVAPDRSARSPKRARTRAGARSTVWIQFASRWDSQCSSCGTEIYEGDKVWWKRGEGTRCAKCGRP